MPSNDRLMWSISEPVHDHLDNKSQIIAPTNTENLAEDVLVATPTGLQGSREIIQVHV